MTQHNRVNYDLFISYAEDDSSWVCGYLIPELGLPSDRVITKEQFTPGASIIREFDRAVNESRFTVLVLTPGPITPMSGRCTASRYHRMPALPNGGIT